MHVSCRLHVAEDVVLQVADRFQGEGDVLVDLDVADHLGGFGPLGEVDEVGAFDDGGDSVFDEGEVGKVDACTISAFLFDAETDLLVPKKGMHGGFDRFNVSLYSVKFFVLLINFRMLSSTVCVRELT